MLPAVIVRQLPLAVFGGGIRSEGAEIGSEFHKENVGGGWNHASGFLAIAGTVNPSQVDWARLRPGG